MKKDRNYTVDLIRIIASFGVIAIHVHADTVAAKTIGDFFSPLSVPFFFIASLVYFVISLNKVSTKDILIKTFSRILLPYLSWTTIYLILLISKAHLANGSYHFIAWRALIYGESAVQLYFLPDLLALQITALGLYLLINSNYIKKLNSLLLLLVGITFFWVGNHFNCFGIGNAGTILRLGFLIFCGFFLPPFFSKKNLRFVCFLVGISFTLLSVVFMFGNVHFAIMNYPVNIAIGGLGLMLIAIGAPLQHLPIWLLKLSANSYGIYLSHVLFLESFEFFIEKIITKNIEYNFVIKIILVTAIFVLSNLFTNIIRRISLFKYILLGERNNNNL